MKHWTDDEPSPVFNNDPISTDGPQGNIFCILGTAIVRMRMLHVPRDRIEALQEFVRTAGSYNAAIACIERWFKVDRQ